MHKLIPYRTVILKEPERSASVTSILNEERDKEERVKKWLLKKEKQTRQKLLDEIKIAKKKKNEMEVGKKERRKHIEAQKKLRDQKEKELLILARMKLKKIKKANKF